MINDNRPERDGREMENSPAPGRSNRAAPGTDGAGEGSVPGSGHGTGEGTNGPVADGAPSPQGEPGEQRPRGAPDFVVGIGASAGGLTSIESFFHQVPANGRTAYVLVQHLSPDHRSLMAEIMVKHTSLQVVPADQDMRLQADTLYLIPPNKVLRVQDGAIELHDRNAHQLHFPIDVFFRSLAENYGNRGIAVVLSGTGSDGTNGIRDVKQAGGTVLVQDDTAQFDGMPRSAISTGLADFILPPEGIAAKILDITRQELDGLPTQQIRWSDAALKSILATIRHVTETDFRGYRDKTMRRRIEKRMWLRQVHDADVYAQILSEDREEVKRLSRELLIGVTSMFRDPEAFDAVREHVLPQLLKDQATVRIWVVGCSTGEEAYSLGILIDEYMREHKITATYRIFATDIDDRAIQQAGLGVLGRQSVQEMSESLLDRYFSREGDNYRIAPRIRERIVFAKHDVIKDPPFTKVDMVSCRNMLIYQIAELQARTIGVMQFALREHGFLWLGPSEALAGREHGFVTLDKRWRLFRRSEQSSTHQPHRRPESSSISARRSLVERQVHRQEALLLGRVCSALVGGEGQVALVVSETDTILYQFGDTASYSAIPEGRPTQTLTRALIQPIGNYLAGLVRRSRREGLPTLTGRTVIDRDGVSIPVDVGVQRIEITAGDPLHVIAIRQDESQARDRTSEFTDLADLATNDRISELESDLVEARSNLQMTIEELESSNEELQSANEELLASNEELQSTNEELHSVNEELHTVNAEYQRKLAEQHLLTADMEHLLQTTDVGTLFLDSDLRVRRYTPAITRVIPLLPSDQGRPVGHIKHRLLDVDLEQVAARTKKDKRVELQAQSSDNLTFELRSVPYNDFGDHIDGVVITLFDVTALECARRKAADGERMFQQVVANIDEAIWIRNRDNGAFLYLSPVAEGLLGRATADLMDSPDLWMHAVHEDDRERVESAYRRGLEKGIIQLEYRVCTPDGQLRWIRDRAFPMVENGQERVEKLAGVTTDITIAKQTEDELRDHAQSMSRLALVDALTGLSNRRAFDDHLTAEVTRARRNGDPLAAVLIDCDNFKEINDRHGHNAGDDVLREVANRLAHALRPTDVLSRIGGDEFVALLPATRNAEALRVAERMRHTIADKPVFAAGHDLQVTVSIGVDAVNTESTSTSAVLSDLHHGLGRSKALGKNRVLDARGDGVTPMYPDQLRAMLRNPQAIRVVAQAIHDLADDSIVGYELLSRGPAGDYESPDALFRLATDFDMLTVVDKHCLQECLLVANAVLAADPNHRVHLNAFPATLLEERGNGLHDAFRKITSLGRVCLEISEQQVVGEPTYLREDLAELRRLGMKVAIDDVGFGRSSLESLILLEPDVIKIDRAFVKGVSQEPARRQSLNRLLNVSRGLATEVVAEGVETREDSKALADLGVKLAQGFLWDRPAPLPSKN
ncbi:MAG: chemotaxis protein CheB [Planctomycetota bacterium]